jgi:23S rRNA pseudouridine1911/1915/1917 synthase
MKARYTVEKAEAGGTLAALLRARGSLAWSRARALVERGKVSVDGERVLDPAARVRAGQEVAIDEAARVARAPARGAIVFEDTHVVVLDKPAGISSVPWELRERDTALDLVRENWKQAGLKTANEVALHVVHRIDKDTSGLILFCKTKAAEKAFAALFRTHAIERLYRCVVHGRPLQGRIESRFVEDRGDGLRGSARKKHGPRAGKTAVTHVRVLESWTGASLCEVRLETGKTHQIRIHLAESGHPLVGERVYVRDFLRDGHTPIESERLLLHAATLGFVHPFGGAKVSLESPLPADFTHAMERLRRHR